ncbi:hypothetical protein OESDEN_06967 [Oesophagostomum dentatum]|uniref:Uncharacterized protein n=1 Tax=Oesophagostomum dentatum TaxID=61180 RepID=A0A0B1TBG8_OESDE|nr:hypothetical protein OESDEN_06967 [Oesophagostomum dentatum]
MQILDDNSLMTLSSGGRGKAIKYFNKRLADIHELSHDTVPPRIHLNIFTPTRVSRFNHHYYFKTYENWCLALWRKGKQHDAVEIITDDYDLQSEDSDTENPTGLDATGSGQSYRSDLSTLEKEKFQFRNVTLEDFVNHKQSTPRRRHKQNSRRRRTGPSVGEVTGNSQTPAPLLDISKVVNSHHIFEIVDVNLENVDSFNLQKEVALVLPAYCTLQWFGDERISVRSKPTDKPFFVLFFETRKEQEKLRIRINTNTSYSNTARRESLLETLQTSRNFGSLFTDLIEFIFKAVQREPKQESNRFQKVREAFLPANNSEMLASRAQRCSELDKLKYIEPYYGLDDYEIISKPQEDPVICYQCKSTYHTDLFLTMDDFFEKFNLEKGERLLSITCCCDNIFYVPEYSAHGAACPARNCSATYDKRGLMRCRFRFNSSLRWLFWRKQHFHCEKEHDLQVTPKPLEPKKLIRKEVASICVAARIERFYTSMRLEFENSVAKSTCSEREQCQVKDLRKTILFLVENCTAWIYLHCSEKHVRAKSQIGKLFQAILILQEEILRSSSTAKAHTEEIQKGVTEVLGTFRKCTGIYDKGKRI